MSLDYSWERCSPEAKEWLDLNFEYNVWNLSCATVATGIPKITKANAYKFWRRYCAIQYAQGMPTYVTLDMVRMCVGFSTNASTMTDPQFAKRLADVVMEHAPYLVRLGNLDIKPKDEDARTNA